MASGLTRSFLFGSRGNFYIHFDGKIPFIPILVLQTSFVRTLATGQNKGPMDYVKQGVDQLGQAAEKVKEAVSSATSTVVDAVSGDSNASRLILIHETYEKIKCFSDQKTQEAKQHGELFSEFNQIAMKENLLFSGNRAADNFRNAADEAKNRSGYGASGSRSSSPSSSGYGSGQSATDKVKDKTNEFAQQAKSAV